MCADKDIKIHERTRVHDGFLKLDQFALQFEQFDGTMSAVVDRELFVAPYPSVGIVLYDPIHQKIVLVEQFRLGAWVNQLKPWILELVMGMRDDPQESAEATARREALEEAGVIVKSVTPIACYLNSPGVSNERVSLFCGEIDIESIQGFHHGVAAEGEDIKVWQIDLASIPELISNGTIADAASLVGLQWLLLNKATLW
jgi:ADP-ribose pyrophosphatase